MLVPALERTIFFKLKTKYLHSYFVEMITTCSDTCKYRMLVVASYSVHCELYTADLL